MHDPTPAAHAQHDLELIAGHAAGDLAEADRARADDILRSCTSCADIRRDLLAIAEATSSLPASAAPRDFRLTTAQAASLRRGSWVASLLRPFAAPRSQTRPLAMAFTSLGLAGLLVLNILPALFGGLGAAGALSSAAERAGAAPGATAAPAAEVPGPQAASSAPGVFPVSGGPQATGDRNGYVFGPQTQPTAALDQSGGSKSNGATAAPGGVADMNAEASGQPSLDRLAATERSLLVENETNPVFIGSLVLLVLGLALFGLRFLARRVR